MRQETARLIHEIINDDFFVGLPRPTDSSRFEDLEMDSLDMTGFAVALEDQFGIVIPKEDIKMFVTINDAINYVEARLRG